MAMASRLLEGLKELVIAQVSHAVQQTVFLEDVLPHESSIRLGVEALTISVRGLLQRLNQGAIFVSLDELVELCAPDDLDDVEACTPIGALVFLHNFRVAAHRTVEPLIIAVDDEDHVVQAFATGHRDGSDALRLVHFAIADEGPHTALGSVSQAPKVQVAKETGLIDSGQRSQAHGDCGVLPEVRHEPWVRIARQSMAI
mmetsp:Transcript_54040/g.116059  ORF Transcript_54040/g.116059 Transcript_54040/m.116059 type:complete len:200 (+) Transcript_54040:1600-2199(+)